MVGREAGRERELRGKYWHGETGGRDCGTTA